LAGDFAKGLAKGALVTGVVLVGLVFLPEEAFAAAVTGLAWLGYYGTVTLGWSVGSLLGKQIYLIANQNNMTPEQITALKNQIVNDTHQLVGQAGEMVGGYGVARTAQGPVAALRGMIWKNAGAPNTGPGGGGAAQPGGVLKGIAAQDAPAGGAQPGQGGGLKGIATAQGDPSPIPPPGPPAVPPAAPPVVPPSAPRLPSPGSALAPQFRPPIPGKSPRANFDIHLAGPEPKPWKSNELYGTHNQDNARTILKERVDDRDITLKPTDTPGISELTYKYITLAKDTKGQAIPGVFKIINGSKTVYDPKIISDSDMNKWAKAAGKDALEQYVLDQSATDFKTVVNGIKFQSYIRLINGIPVVDNVHPIAGGSLKSP